MTDYSYLEEGVSPTDPKQLRIMKRLANHLAKTPGYEPLKIFRGKGTITAKEAEDCVSILEAPRALFGDAAGWGNIKRSEQWSLLVQGWPKDDPLNPSDPAYVLKAAVEKQLAAIVANEDAHGRNRSDPLYLLGRDCASIEIGQGIVRPVSQEQGNSRLAEFFIPLLLEVQTDKLNPSK